MKVSAPAAGSIQDDGVQKGDRIEDMGHGMHITLLTGGSDKPYVFGLASELSSKGTFVELIGSDELDCPEIRTLPRLNFFNLRGDLAHDAGLPRKISRVLSYYLKLIRYAATAKPRIFHILWNNKFLTFDRTLLMLYYRSLGKKVVLTAHNVNERSRDSNDTFLNRLTLRIQYRLAHHIFVHTEKAKLELVEQFGAQTNRITLIPFGINNAVPHSQLTTSEARQRLGIRQGEKTILFFGRITPYKGLEYLVAAFRRAMAQGNEYRLVIAGRPDRSDKYWTPIREDLSEDVQKGRVLLRAEFIPDEETEIYFKAADVLVLPYKDICQSGVLFLSHSFGLPVLAADVGSMKDDIVEGKTGFVFKSCDPDELANTINRYFESELFARLDRRRQEIQQHAITSHSWDIVGRKTLSVYVNLSSVFLSRNALLPVPTQESFETKRHRFDSQS